MKVMIVGAGKLGVKLAEAMTIENMDVTLVDSDAKVIEKINEHIDVLTVVASGISVTMLNEMNIEEYDIIVATTENDETNVVICTFAKKLGCNQTIARIRNPEYTEQLSFVRHELGIDLIINPDFATANAIAKYLLKNVMFYTGDFADGKVKMIDFKISYKSALVGKRLYELEDFDDLIITAISRHGELIIPDGKSSIEAEDVIHIMGTQEDLLKLSKKHKLLGNDKHVDSVMIIGGGNVGYYLAKELSEAKVATTLIEQDRARALKLAEKLDHVLIINGDGTDVNILEEENIDQMDAFIGSTGYDEQNLLMALMAKQYGVGKCIAKVSRKNYTKIIDKLDIDAALNPVNITASDILKYVRGGKVVSVSLLLGGDGEVTEIIATKDMSYLDRPLKDLNLPKGLIIGAIVHNGDVIIPKGSSVIRANDRIVVFSRAEDTENLKKLFTPGKRGRLSELWNNSKSAWDNPAD